MPGTYTKLYYHLVFSTKNRLPTINDSFEIELHKYIAGIIRNIGGASIEVNGTADHIHILTILLPKLSLSDVLRTIKSNSSKWIHENKHNERFAWQDGYAAFTVSPSQFDAARAYIREQKLHHGKRNYKSELVELLLKHGVEYDERYLWD